MQRRNGAWGGISAVILIIVAIVRIAGGAQRHQQDTETSSFEATGFADARASCTRQGGFFLARDQYYFNATCIVPATRSGSASAGAASAAGTPAAVRTIAAAATGAPPATWTAPDGTISLVYPSSWSVSHESTDPDTLLFLRAPDNAAFAVLHSKYPTLTVDGEERQIQQDLPAADPNNAYTFDPPTTVTIGGETGMLMNYHITPKSDPNAASTTSSFWFVEHNGVRYVFRGGHLGRAGALEDAIVASVTFPPAPIATPATPASGSATTGTGAAPTVRPAVTPTI